VRCGGEEWRSGGGSGVDGVVMVVVVVAAAVLWTISKQPREA
jgi:hypothetical protein